MEFHRGGGIGGHDLSFSAGPRGLDAVPLSHRYSRLGGVFCKADVAANGLDTTAVSLVNDSITCNAVINSYNTASDSSLRVVSGYVVQTDSNYVLFLPPATGTPYKTQVVVIFDRQFNLVVRMEGAG